MTGRLNSSFPAPELSTGLMLWQVTNAWQREIRAALAPFDLTHVQFVLLAVLAHADDGTPVTQRELARRAATDPMMTSQVLRTLEGKRLVERLPHPVDRRARAVAATPAGIDLANHANAAVEAADHSYFSTLGPKVPDFTESLAALYAANDDANESDSAPA